MAKMKAKCGCWKGYKRVPGTKPCSPGSCMAMGEMREEKAEAKEKSATKKRLSMRRKKA